MGISEKLTLWIHRSWPIRALPTWCSKPWTMERNWRWWDKLKPCTHKNRPKCMNFIKRKWNMKNKRNREHQKTPDFILSSKPHCSNLQLRISSKIGQSQFVHRFKDNDTTLLNWAFCFDFKEQDSMSLFERLMYIIAVKKGSLQYEEAVNVNY